MKFRSPSLLTQIIFMVLIILGSSVLLYRSFFMEKLQDYITGQKSVSVEDQISDIYQAYRDIIPDENQDDFRSRLQTIISNERQRQLGNTFFRKDMAYYSMFMLAFLIIVMFIFSILVIKAITRPIARLQEATRELAQGNLNVSVQESRYSPVNDLIHSFNGMVQELAASRDRLIQAEKDAVWKDMARVMAHEIKNPLTPILLTTERMEYKYFKSSDDLANVFPESIKVIKEEVANLKKLTVEFSQFARMPKSNFTEVSLNICLEEFVTPYMDRAEVELNLDPKISEIRADKFQLKQVMTNLVQNGIQACEKNAKITINTKLVDHTVRIQIRDNGKGISKEDLSRIFEPYFSKREKGTGLGLPIVKRIIEQHDGRISVTSKVGEGTDFQVELPASQPHQSLIE